MNCDWDNVILLSADALRADHLSYHGYTRHTSPVLDELAEESHCFLNAYSASSHTREAVPALLTGEYPDTAIDSGYRLVGNSIALMLSEEGYSTAGFHSNPFVSRAYGFDQGFDEFNDDLHLGQHRLIALAQRAIDKLRNRHYARAEEINQRALSWIDSLEPTQPFFLWNHYMDTHGPYEPPNGYATLFRDSTIPAREAQSLYQRAIKNPTSISADERQLLIDLYDAEIRYNDEHIGQFLDALRERDLLDNSLLIFTADHGDAFDEHGYYEHPRQLHEEITHVPLLVRRPGNPGRTYSEPVSTLDIAATLESEVGRDVSADGVSLFDSPAQDRSVFLQARGEKDHSHIRRYAIRTATGSCYCERDRSDGSITFTDCTDESHRTRLEEHVGHRVRVEDGEVVTESEDVDEEIERRLSALGYKE